MSEVQGQEGPVSGPVRMTSADPAIMFARLEEAGLIARGGVNIIALDTVRERLGERWARKRPVVWEHVQAAGERHLGPADLCFRINDTDFAVAVSSADAVTARGLCLRVLREVLEHFLGACRTEDLVIRSVTGLENGEVRCTPLDPAQISHHAPAQPAPVAAPEPQARAPRDRTRPREQPFIMTAMGGRDLKLRHDWETLVAIAGLKPTATVLEPSVIDVASGRRIPGYAFARLTDPDLWAIDGMTVAAAAEAASEDPALGPFLLPLSYQSISGSRGRARVVDLLGGPAGRGLAVAITNVEPGTPRGCLAEAVAMLRRMEVTVLLRVAPVRDALAALDLAKPNGVILDVEPLNGHADRIRQAMAAFVRQAHGVGTVIALRGAANPAAVKEAADLGFTHWSAPEGVRQTRAA